MCAVGGCKYKSKAGMRNGVSDRLAAILGTGPSMASLGSLCG